MKQSQQHDNNDDIKSPLLLFKNTQIDGSSTSHAPAPAPEENSPIEQVALTVPVTDNPNLPAVTFRVWVLGAVACVVLSFLNQFFWYRREPLSITSVSAQIAVVPLGHLMAAVMTDRIFCRGKWWEFSLNPGPFNVKEHVLITIFANSGAGNPYAIHIVSAIKIFYGKTLTFWVALTVVVTTQVLGFGWAGIFRRYLVEPAAMWWPQNLVQVSLFRELWELSKSTLEKKQTDVHTKLMRQYNQVPEWWFICLLLSNIVATLFVIEYYKNELQIPWWAFLLACGLAFFFTLPLAVITATTNQTPGLNVITEYIIGYMYPGYPMANMCFKVYGYISVKQSIVFLQDFKLGHYMKIPPRSMFLAQVCGTLISALVHLGTSWWLMDTVPNICDRAMLPPGSPWTCPSDHVFYDASVIYGLIGPRLIFGDLGYYNSMNWSFLVGASAPITVWLLHKAFPRQKWIKLITTPVLLGATIHMPPATSVNYNSWIVVGFLSGFVAYRYCHDWWGRLNYVLSGALDAGLAFMAVLVYVCLDMEGVGLEWWGSKPDGCPLALCPAAEGIMVDGCPII